MFGKGEPVDLQIRHLEADIVRVRFDQVALQLQLEEAVAAEVRGLALASTAPEPCRSGAGDSSMSTPQAISSLQDEIAELLPKPRAGA